jgi:serine/threonine protein kinase
MTGRRALSEREIFIAAVQLAAAERAAYVDDACGSDVALLAEVRSLLDAHDSSHGCMQQPGLALPAVEDSLSLFCARLEERTLGYSIAEQPGAVIGPYKLLMEIGAGGMGKVYMAEQEHPVRRRVALKIIKPGMDTREVIARFEAERQALALMDHPNIAKVHDAGATENGRPYFVMELVHGVPITEYCDHCNLTTRDRLELFIVTCRAVQHAHQKGVIHRDIKPTNVLVAMQDGRPEPKIIDFGLAKAINQRLTEHTLATSFAQMIGTPLYMSPEQAELSPLGVDTRTDIYSLGVLLYELLTGTTPFDKDRLQAASYDEMRRIISEEEPPRPSARISTLVAALASTVAEHRRTDVRRLRQTVHGELDWIVMKCLEKDRNRRYETPNSLVRDIARYLNDEPVQACPPSMAYRLKKFVRRNKIAAAFVLLLIVAVAALSLSNIQTRRSRQRAITENAKAQAIAALLQDMLRSANPDEVQAADYTVRQMLDDFATNFESGLPDQKEVEADIRTTIGRAYWRLGVPEKAESQLKRALELRKELADPDDESVAQVLVEMAWCRNEQALLGEAAETAKEALRIYHARGTTGSPKFQAVAIRQRALISMNDLDAAEQVGAEALAEARQSGAEYPEVAVILHAQADLLVKRGLYLAAEDAARRAVDMHRRLHGPMHPETAWGHRSLAGALEKQYKFQEAESELRHALAIFRQRYRGKHHSITNVTIALKCVLAARNDQAGLAALAREEAEVAKQGDQGDYHLRLAERLLVNGSIDEVTRDVARQLIQRAIDEYGSVKADSPNNRGARFATVNGYIDIAELCANKPDFRAEVEEAHRRLTSELKDLLASFPACEEDVAHRHRLWALAVQWNGDFATQAEQAFREAASLFEGLWGNKSDQPEYLYFLTDTYTRLGDVLSRSGDGHRASSAFEPAVRIHNEHAAEIQEFALRPYDVETVWSLVRIADFLNAAHRGEEAARFVQRANAVAKRIANVSDSTDALYYLALGHLRLKGDSGYRAACASLAESIGNDDLGAKELRRIWTWCLGGEALADMSVALKHVESLVEKDPQNRDYGLALGALYYRTHQYEQAAKQLQESSTAYTDVQCNSVYSRLLLAMTLWRLDRHDEARRIFGETLPALDEQLRSPANGWNLRVTLELLRDEVESLFNKGERQPQGDS